MKIRKGMIFIAASILLSAMAQLMMKAGTQEIHGLSGLPLINVWPAFIWIIAGLGCYALSMFLWMAALARYELSFAYPLLSLSYVLVYMGAALWPRLHESVSLYKTGGVLLVVIGVVLVTMRKKN